MLRCVCCLFVATKRCSLHFIHLLLSFLFNFGQEGYNPKMLYFVFLPSLFAGLPLVAVLVGCAVLRSWQLHYGHSARHLNKLLASAPPQPRHPRSNLNPKP
jgi:hypothetical protein